MCLRERGGGIEAVASIAFGGDAAGDQAEDFGSDRDGEAVAGIGAARVGVIAPGFFNRGIDQRCIAGQGRGLQQERWVGGGIERAEAGNGFDVAGIGDNCGKIA